MLRALRKDKTQPKFWDNFWRQHKTIHREAPYPFLKQFIESHSGIQRILIPLCGQNQDLLLLAQQGFDVTGVDFSKTAIEHFFTARNIAYKKQDNCYQHADTGVKLSLWHHDFFDFRPENPRFDFIYDVGGLVALPETLRKHYAIHLQHFIGPNTNLLILTKDTKNTNPPFFVSKNEIKALFPNCHHKALKHPDCPNITGYLLTVQQPET